MKKKMIIKLNEELYEVLQYLNFHFNDVTITVLQTKRSTCYVLGYSTYIVGYHNLNIFFVEIGKSRYYGFTFIYKNTEEKYYTQDYDKFLLKLKEFCSIYL